jgi:hypothetical protein
VQPPDDVPEGLVIQETVVVTPDSNISADKQNATTSALPARRKVSKALLVVSEVRSVRLSEVRGL